MRIRSSKDRNGIILFLVILFVLLLTMGILNANVQRNLRNPFRYQLRLEETATKNIRSSAGLGNADGSVHPEDEYTYTVDMSKHWINDPNGPLQSYGAQYDNTIENDSKYDIVNWSVIISVPERNITIDSYWNGEWEYDKQEDMIRIVPDDKTATIASGGSVTFGAVMISENLMEFEDVSVTGYRYRPITAYPLFWILMTLLIVWTTAAIAFVLYLIREENHRKNSEKLNNVISQTMTTIANFIDTKDRDTKGHSTRVSYYSQKIAEKLGMSEEEVRDIGYIGLLHDCGKLSIPEQILNKPGKLTEEEFDVMRRHTTHGENILKDFTSLDGLIDGVLYHHERYDGTGYMTGLAGEDIPLVARIICVADALDAMNSDRCYRSHLTREVILDELEKNKGTQFDPKIAQIMIDMINSGEVFVGDGKD